MKKVFLVIYCFWGIASYSKEINLDMLLNEISKTSYQNKLYEIKKSTNDSKEKYYKLDTFNGIETSVSSEYSDQEDSFQTTGKISYGPFYVEGTKPYNSDDDYASFGIEKSLKDLIFSKSDNELSKLGISREIDRVTHEKNMETQKIDLINLYRDYKINELELKIKKNGLVTLKKEEDTMKKSFNLGAIAKIELDTLQYSIKNLEIEIKNLEDNLIKLQGRFYYEYKFDIRGSSLAEIAPVEKNIDELLIKYGTKDLDKLKYQKELTNENLKYLKYDDKMPEISLGVEHSTRFDENRVVAKFSKKLFDFNYDLEEEKNSLLEQEVTLKQKIDENEAEKLQAMNNYYNYLKEYEVNKNKAELELSKYNIRKLEYNLGKVNYIDVMESFDDYLDYEVAKEKAINTLNGYIYEIMVRGE
ncbi:TolC family protein [Fusobacterium varium]|uniref:TolC family protein n=1 Tax=Fusobacterium varium TaxID=856 RepID=UPI000E538CC1|nr:TolC family protein [Fusobacterium varium]RHG34564.1 TolC family protein [Fusobacterium varium]